MFDKKEFVESVIAKGRSLDEIVKEARAEIRQMESRPIRPVGSSDHVRFLHSLVFFLQSGEIPENLSDDDFQILLRVTKYLVDRGDLNPALLEQFGAG